MTTRAMPHLQIPADLPPDAMISFWRHALEDAQRRALRQLFATTEAFLPAETEEEGLALSFLTDHGLAESYLRTSVMRGEETVVHLTPVGRRIVENTILEPVMWRPEPTGPRIGDITDDYVPDIDDPETPQREWTGRVYDGRGAVVVDQSLGKGQCLLADIVQRGCQRNPTWSNSHEVNDDSVAVMVPASWCQEEPEPLAWRTTDGHDPRVFHIINAWAAMGFSFLDYGEEDSDVAELWFYRNGTVREP